MVCAVRPRQLVTYVAYTNADRGQEQAILRVRSGDIPTMRNGGQPRLSSDDTTNTVAYAPLGNVTQDVRGEVVRTLRYDGQDRLAGLRSRERSWESNRYDQLGRRMWQQNADGFDHHQCLGQLGRGG